MLKMAGWKMRFAFVARVAGIAFVAVLLGVVWASGQEKVSAEAPVAPVAPSNLYLPFIKGGVPATPPPGNFFIGVYNNQYYGTQATVNQYLLGLDSWAGLSRSAGKGHAISGDFNDLEVGNPDYNVPVPLEMLWSNGYTDFINLNSGRSAYAYASGQVDASIHAWARAYKSWVSQGQNRRAFLAPLPEMNGNWTAYGCDPGNFKLAYQRIQNIFAQEGVSRSQVWWVFAPNGWSSPCANNAKIKDYYPGDTLVDIIAFSAYNFGTCPSSSQWQTPDQVFGPYISEIRNTVSSAKPIFIGQTGVSTFGGDKDQWLRDAYQYLAVQNVRGVIYFNIDTTPCQGGGYYIFSVYNPSGNKVQGYKDAVNLSYTQYLSPGALATYTFPP